MKRRIAGALAGVFVLVAVIMMMPAVGQAKVLDAGGSHLLVVEEDGTIKAWGKGVNGQLGNSQWNNQSSPVQVDGNLFVSVSGGYTHSAGLKAGGSVWSWGRNHLGQLGIGSTSHKNTPQEVDTYNASDPDANVIMVSSGESFTVALTDTGKVYAWGDNLYGQLGQGYEGGNESSPVMVDFSGVVTGKIVSISAGAHHVLALDEDGNVFSWGYNQQGQLGTGDTANKTTPQAITFEESPGVEYAGAMVRIMSGGYFSLVVDESGELWSWGHGWAGQLGKGYILQTPDYQAEPARTGLTGVVSVAAGLSHALGLKNDGKVYGFGSNSQGQSGVDAGTTRVQTPTYIEIDSCKDTGDPATSKNVVAISADNYNSAALCDDGEVYAWGTNPFTQLGPNSTCDNPDLQGLPCDGHNPGYVDYSHLPIPVGTFSPSMFFGEFRMLFESNSKDEHYGFAVDVDGDYAVIGSRHERVSFLERIDGVWTLKSTVTGAAYTDFGISVALSGERAIIGSYADEYYAYIYKRGETDWELEAVLDGRDLASQVDIEGTRAIVGSNWPDALPVLIYELIEGQWRLVAEIANPNGQGSSGYGTAVSISGDYAIVGAPAESMYAQLAGAAYIISRDANGVWSLNGSDRLAAPVAQAYEYYGMSVSITGNASDGYTAMVGGKEPYVYTLSSGGTWASEAIIGDDIAGAEKVSIKGDYAIVKSFDQLFVYRKLSSSLYQTGILKIPSYAVDLCEDGQAGIASSFGYSIAIDGDSVIAGDPYLDQCISGINVVDSGQVYIFE